MSRISEYVHKNILRFMCESQINERNKYDSPISTLRYKKPDIEMGFKLFPIETINIPTKANYKNTYREDV